MAERMMATAWRFERNLGNPNSKKAVQEAKIANYEVESRAILNNQKTAMEVFKTKWNDDFDNSNDIYKSRNLSKAEVDELNVIKKASILVRREALKQLYRKDLQSYEVELNARGLSIHRERL